MYVYMYVCMYIYTYVYIYIYYCHISSSSVSPRSRFVVSGVFCVLVAFLSHGTPIAAGGHGAGPLQKDDETIETKRI